MVRNISEGCRSSLREFFHLEAVDRILPGPRARIRRKTDAILHSTPLKNTLGLMHWFQQRA
jgi:hypothetical protein